MWLTNIDPGSTKHLVRVLQGHLSPPGAYWQTFVALENVPKMYKKCTKTPSSGVFVHFILNLLIVLAVLQLVAWRFEGIFLAKCLFFTLTCYPYSDDVFGNLCVQKCTRIKSVIKSSYKNIFFGFFFHKPLNQLKRLSIWTKIILFSQF